MAVAIAETKEQAAKSASEGWEWVYKELMGADCKVYKLDRCKPIGWSVSGGG